MSMKKKRDKRIWILGSIILVGILFGSSMLLSGVMPGLYTITSDGNEIISGDTVDYLDGLELTMEWQGYEDGMSIDCDLWDIEIEQSIEQGVFSIGEQANVLIWTFTLDDVRNDTNPYQLILTGDATGSTFAFYIMGEEGEEEPPPPPEFDDPIISEMISNNTSPNVGEDIKIIFKVETYCNYQWDIKIDDAIVDSGIISSGGDYRVDYLDYIGTQTINGTYTYTLEIEYVKDGEWAYVDDSIDVTWIGITPTTTPTDTTSTGTLPTDDDIIPEDFVANIPLYVGIGAVIFVVVYILTNKKVKSNR